MEWVWIVLITIVLLAAISIAVAAIIIAVNKEPNVNASCSSQSDCLIGYVCSDVGTGGTGICKAGVGTPCTNNNNCANDLICTNGRCAQSPASPLQIPSVTHVSPTLPNKTISEDIPLPSYSSPVKTPITSVAKVQTSTPVVNEEVVSTPVVNKELVSTLVVNEEVRQPTPLMVVKSGEHIIPVSRIASSAATSIIRNMRDHKSATPNKDEMVRNVIPRSQQRYHAEVTSIDDEENSAGSVREVPFDIRSADSEEDITPRVSTPYQERNGVYYCRSNVNEILGVSHEPHSPVIDVCSYSNATVFLLEDGNITCEVKNGNEVQRRKATCNVHLNRITSFSGYLYGVGDDHRLYTLPNSYFTTTNWIWSVVDWAPNNITHISSTYNSSHLWIQTNEKGILYNTPGTPTSEEIRYTTRRVYGRDVDHYIDIDPNKFTAVIQPGGALVNNVYDGALSYYDEVVAIHPSERHQYRRITIVNWNPYYIRA